MEKFYKRFTCKKWRKFFIGDFHVKLKVSFEFFIRDFPGKKIKRKKFLKGFFWKIEAGGKILKGFPFKFTTWLVLHVLHFIGIFYNPRASLARAAFKRDFLVKLKAISFFWSKLRKVKFKGISFKSGYLKNFLWSPLSTSYPRACEWKSEVKVKSIFGPLIFFVFRYVERGVLGNNYISIKKCTTIFLWVWYFKEVGEIFKNFQKHPRGESFWKNGV